MNYTPALIWSLTALSIPLIAQAAAPDFQLSIEPIFKKRCVGCHGAQQQMGGVRLDDRTSALAGGYAGPIIKLGDSARSLLFQMITTGKNGKVMPPVGPRLTAAEVEIIRKWLDAGGTWPEGGHVAASSPQSSL